MFLSQDLERLAAFAADDQLLADGLRRITGRDLLFVLLAHQALEARGAVRLQTNFTISSPVMRIFIPKIYRYYSSEKKNRMRG